MLRRSLLAAAPAFLFPSIARAADDEIKIGNIMPYSGPASSLSEVGKAETAYTKMLNDRGGINKRRVNFITLDDSYSPPKAVEHARRLVEQDNVALMFSPLGTPSISATIKYFNDRKVPHLFAVSGVSRFSDPNLYPYTITALANYQVEARIYAKLIAKERPNGKIAVLYQNDDYGKDFLTGLKDALGSDANKIIAEANYELTSPTIDSQVIQLKTSGADTLLHFSTPKFAAQALKKVQELGWKPTQFLASPINSVQTVLTPAGLENVQGVLTTQFTKQAGDPAWAQDPEVIEFLAFMKKWVPNDSPNDFIALSGYINAQAIAIALKRCGDDLTRDNLLNQATSFKKDRVAMLLPGVELNNSKENYAPYGSLRMAKFENASWKLLD